jgi:hypothetical protein
MAKSVASIPPIRTQESKGLSNEDSERFFGPPPLISREEKSRYEAIRMQISQSVRPRDFLEEIWVNDVVVLVWEAIRLRRLKANLLQAEAHEGLLKVLTPLLGPRDARDYTERCVKRAPKSSVNVITALRSAELTMDEVMAQTLALNIDNIERTDAMIAAAEARRNIALQEMDRHRAALGESLRRAADETIDADGVPFISGRVGWSGRARRAGW